MSAKPPNWHDAKYLPRTPANTQEHAGCG